MATSVHIPKPLLQAVDRKARNLQISRNKLILRALEREVSQSTEWSPTFFERVLDVDRETASAVEEIERVIKAGRSSKKPPRL
jgi:hypothetical protein